MRLDLLAQPMTVRSRPETTDVLRVDEASAFVAMISAYGTPEESMPAASAAIEALDGFRAQRASEPNAAIKGIDPDQDPQVSLLQTALRQMHETLAQLPSGPVAATALALHIQDAQLAVSWAGHVRLYLWRHGIFHGVTLDHTPENEPEAPFVIDFDDGTAVTRALGLPMDVTPDLGLRTLYDGDLLVVATAELWQRLPTPELARLLSAEPLATLRDRLVAATGISDLPLVLIRVSGENAPQSGS